MQLDHDWRRAPVGAGGEDDVVDDVVRAGALPVGGALAVGTGSFGAQALPLHRTPRVRTRSQLPAPTCRPSASATSTSAPKQVERTEYPEHSEPVTTSAPRSRRRRVKIILGITALTLAAAAGGGYLWLNAVSDVKDLGVSDCNAVKPQVTATPAGAAAADDQRAVCQTLRSMKDAWARHDATAYGDQFTQDATYTSYVGTAYQGRDDIAEAHRALFDGFLKGTKLSDSWLSLRFYGPDTAVATSRGDTYEGGEPEAADLSRTQSYTLVRQADDTWRIAAFQNTKRQRVMERISFLFSPDTKPAAEK